MTAPSVAFHHFGCKVNFAEASAISRQFKEEGYSVVGFHEQADFYVISTCAVTAVAEKKCRNAIRQAHRQNPSARIAVIGCFPQLRPDEISQMEGVAVVLGHSDKFTLLEEIGKLEPGKSISEIKARELQDTFIPSYSFGDRTRSFLKIQDGCDYYCAYCTIPLARGHSRSDSIENVIRNARQIIAEGGHEIVLTGVNIGDFGRNRGESLPELMHQLNQIAEIPRIRLSSIEPDLLKDEMIDLVAGSERFMPHFHIPLQSGSDRILKAMKRKYDTDLYASRIRKIRSVMPLACVAADVIVGFPGETDEDFRESVRFIEDTDISYLHVFSYSNRQGTLAAGMQDMVPERIRKERSEELHRISEEKKKAFYMKNQGRQTNVLFEADNTNGFMHGFTENYIKVRIPFDASMINRIVPVRLREFDDDFSYSADL